MIQHSGVINVSAGLAHQCTPSGDLAMVPSATSPWVGKKILNPSVRVLPGTIENAITNFNTLVPEGYNQSLKGPWVIRSDSGTQLVWFVADSSLRNLTESLGTAENNPSINGVWVNRTEQDIREVFKYQKELLDGCIVYTCGTFGSDTR